MAVSTQRIAANHNRKSSSWKAKLSRKLSGGAGATEKSTAIQLRELTSVVKDEDLEEDWLFVNDSGAMDGVATETHSLSKKKSTKLQAPNSAQGGLPPRSNSYSSRSPKLVRPPSPHSGSSPLQRRPSGRGGGGGNRLEVGSQQNGRTRASSPSRARAGSPSRVVRASSPTSRSRNSSPSRSSSVGSKKMMKSSLRTSSPIEPHHSSSNSTSSHPVHNGTSHPGGERGGGGLESPSSFSKVRDTLKITRPKKRKGKGLSYSVVPGDADVSSNPSKYQDPFEASYNAHDTSDEFKLGQGHDFKPVSISHNKPEYCDHCSEMAWGHYRQVVKCSKCDFIAHRKCEPKVTMDCSTRIEQDVLLCDKKAEESVIIEPDEDEMEDLKKQPSLTETDTSSKSHHHSSADHTDAHVSTTTATNGGGPSSVTTTAPSPQASLSSGASSSYVNSQLMTEKTKLSRKIREYNRKTTPVHHIHLRSSHNQTQKDGPLEYQGFVRVHMCVQRPIHVSTAITRTSWYRLMRPVKERTNDQESGAFADSGLVHTAFYLPTDTNRLVHIGNSTTTKELVQILLKKFCVTDNPKKFSLYEEYGSDCRRLFEEDHPLEIALEASSAHRNSKLVLRDNTYSTIQWSAFTCPELQNFVQILQREEEIYCARLTDRFNAWRKCLDTALKSKMMEEVAANTRSNVLNFSSDSSASRKLKHTTKVQSSV